MLIPPSMVQLGLSPWSAGCRTFSELQRVSQNSACGDIVCPGDLVEYNCVAGSSVMVWQISGCRDPLQIVHQEGLDVQPIEKMCEDGKNITADLQRVNDSSFRSTLNITGVQSGFTVQCLSDNGFEEELIGMDKLISTGMLLDRLLIEDPVIFRSKIQWYPKFCANGLKLLWCCSCHLTSIFCRLSSFIISNSYSSPFNFQHYTERLGEAWGYRMRLHALRSWGKGGGGTCMVISWDILVLNETLHTFQVTCICSRSTTLLAIIIIVNIIAETLSAS